MSRVQEEEKKEGIEEEEEEGDHKSVQFNKTNKFSSSITCKCVKW